MEDDRNSALIPTSRKQWIARLLASSKLPYLLALFTIFICAPALKLGLYVDDYLHRLILLGKPFYGYKWDPLFGLFDFISPAHGSLRVLKESGILPWWIPSEIRAGFFRPLSAASHMLDYALWPDNFFIQHAHSVLWYTLGILTIALVYRRCFQDAAAAGLAAIMFAIEDAHAMPVAWLANRNSLLALFFGGLSLLMHIEWKRTGRIRYLPLALMALTAGLLAGEAALGIMAYIFAYQAILDRGSLVKRMAPLVPYGIVVAAWRGVYQALGYGVDGSDVYLDPINSPVAFSLSLIERVPVLMLSQWTQLPIDFWAILPRTYQLALTAAGMAVMIVIGLIFRGLLKESAEARFWALGMLVSLVPLCAGIPMDRMLILTGIGAFGLLAAGAVKAFFSQERGGRLVTWAVGLLLVVHVGFAVILFPLRIWSMPFIWDFAKKIEMIFPHDDGLLEQSVILLNGNVMFTGYIAIIRSLEGGVVPKRITFLAPVWCTLTVQRLDEKSLLIRPKEGFFSRLADKGGSPFKAGDRIEDRDFNVEVVELTPDGRPAAVVFRFHRPLSDPSLRLMYMAPDHILPFELPGVGGEVMIPGLFEPK